MADEPKELKNSLIDPKNAEHKPTVFQSLGKELGHRAGARKVAAENAYREAVNRQGELIKRYHEVSREVQVEVSKNENIDAYTEAARGEIAQQLAEQDAQIAELKLRLNQASASADEVVGKHQANRAEEERRKRQAEADTLDAEISLEMKRQKLDRLRHDRAGILAEANKELQELKDKLQAKEIELEDALDPIFDDDENQQINLKTLERKIEQLRVEISNALKRVEELQ